MLYTFHGPNRTGEAERAHLREAPWVMTGPLVVLGVLSVDRRVAQPPGVLAVGPVQALHHWLEPVTGEAALHITHGAEPHSRMRPSTRSSASRVAIAVGGILYRRARGSSRPRWCRRRSRPRAKGFERVLEHKYFVDEVYDRAIVQPTVGVSRNVLWNGMDSGTHRRAARQRQRVSGARVRLARRAAAIGAGRHLRVGAGHRRAARARRLHVQADRWPPFSTRSATTAGSCRRCWRMPTVGALLVWAHGRATASAAGEAADAAAMTARRLTFAILRRSSSCSRSASGGRSIPPIARLAGDVRRPVDRGVGCPLHARRRRHFADDGPPHHVPDAARVLGGWTSVRKKVHAYHALMLLLTTGMLGVFVARDLFLFYVMWEVMLVPMYFIIGIWGGERRHLCEHQVLHLYDGRVAADAGGDRVPRVPGGTPGRTPELQLRRHPRPTRARADARHSGCSAPSSSRSR